MSAGQTAPVTPASAAPERPSPAEGLSAPAVSGGHPNYFPDEVMGIAREQRVAAAIARRNAQINQALSILSSAPPVPGAPAGQGFYPPHLFNHKEPTVSHALQPIVFQHAQFGAIRVVPIGETTWFVAKDIARVLDLRDANHLTRNIKKEYRGTHIVRTPSGDQQMQLINASGLFQAVMVSRKPQAEPFQQWVLGEVLPGIAKDGEYRDLSNRMGATLAQATDGAVTLAAERADEGPMVEVSMKLLEALRHELVSSRIERRNMAQAFSKSLGQMVRILGVQRMPQRGLDPNRPMSIEEITRAEFLFRSGHSGREVARRLNRSREVIADFMASRPDLLAEAIQSSLI